MTNYNDFDLDMQISQSQGGASPQSLVSIYTQWDCVTKALSDIACTSIATICWALLLWQLLLIQRNP